MKKLITALFLLLPNLAFAQSQRNPCYYTTANPGPGNGCIPVSAANPLPVTGTGGGGPVSISQTTPGTTNGVVSNPQNAASANVSFTTSATPGTATTPIAANANRKVIKFKVEGAGVVCFSKYTTTPVCGATGTFALAAAGTAGNGTGGSYTTPAGFTDQEAWSVVSSTASVVVFADWQ